MLCFLLLHVVAVACEADILLHCCLLPVLALYYQLTNTLVPKLMTESIFERTWVGAVLDWLPSRFPLGSWLVVGYQ